MARPSSQNNALSPAFSESFDGHVSALLIEFRKFQASAHTAGGFHFLDALREQAHPLCAFGRSLRDKGNTKFVFDENTTFSFVTGILP
jgi:hypothetical protein